MHGGLPLILTSFGCPCLCQGRAVTMPSAARVVASIFEAATVPQLASWPRLSTRNFSANHAGRRYVPGVQRADDCFRGATCTCACDGGLPHCQFHTHTQQRFKRSDMNFWRLAAFFGPHTRRSKRANMISWRLAALLIPHAHTFQEYGSESLAACRNVIEVDDAWQRVRCIQHRCRSC